MGLYLRATLKKTDHLIEKNRSVPFFKKKKKINSTLCLIELTSKCSFAYVKLS